MHVRDMANLSERHPQIYDQFCIGRFTVQKTSNCFSSMAIDQAHEQNNANVKRDGGAIGLTQNPELLQRWMVVGPELARIVQEFESSFQKQDSCSRNTPHRDHTRASQATFKANVQSLVATMEEMGNPFDENGTSLYRIDTKEVFGEDAVNAVNTVEALGQEQYQQYISLQLEGDQPLSDPIKKNKLNVFKKRPLRKQ